MSHFAKIVSGRVTEVIVAEQAFIDTLVGQWVETSYGARGGVAHDGQGQVVKGPALRMNYAGIGDIYDSVRDAFYSLQPSPMSYLDEETCTWTQALPNKCKGRKAKGRNRIYVDSGSRHGIARDVWTNLQRSLGVEFVSDIDQAQYSMPLSDTQTYELVQSGTCAPMGIEALHNITDRMGMQTLGIPVVSSSLPKSPEELRTAFAADTKIFVKRRRTYGKDKNILAYTQWDNVETFIAAVGPEFWIAQNDPDANCGEFVIQELLPHPLETLNLHVAVNKYGEAFVWAKMVRVHDEVNVLGRYVPYKGKCIEVLRALCAVCNDQKIRASMHEIEFVWLNDRWTLLDWNPRLTGHFIHSLAAVYPVMDDALLHMMGEEPRGEAHGLYTEQRTYARNGFDDEAKGVAIRLGLYSFIDNLQTVRLSSVGETSTMVINRFTEFEKYLNTRNT